MKFLAPLLAILLLFSCSEDDANDCSSCESLKGKRWYVNTDRDNSGECTFFEDLFLNGDGTVDVWRIGKGFEGTEINRKIENVASYEIDDCKLKVFDLTDNWNMDDLEDCFFSVTISFVQDLQTDESVTYFISDKTCDKFETGILILTDYEPE